MAELEATWAAEGGSVRRDYSAADVVRERPYVHTFGALTGAEAVQMVCAPGWRPST